MRLKRKIFRKSKRIPPHKLSFCEKRLTMMFTTNARMHIGPKLYQNTKPLILGTRQNTTISNINSLIMNLRKMLMLVNIISNYRGLILVSGETTHKYMGAGGRLFYALSPWSNGFLTNFPTLLRHALTDKQLQRSHPRHIPMSAINLKKAPQLPAYHVALQQQHWACNEAGSLLLPQTININKNHSHSLYHPQATLNISYVASLPYGALVFLIRDAIISAKIQEKFFFLSLRPKFIIKRMGNKRRLSRGLKRADNSKLLY